MMVAYYCFKNRWIKYLAMILVVYVFQTQMYMTQTLYYTDKMRNESDIQTAYEIIHDLGENGVKEVFLGGSTKHFLENTPVPVFM
jgi:hypothetical protein